MPKRDVNSSSYAFHSEILKKGGEDLTPKAKGSIPKLAVLLGLLSPFYFDLYRECDGKTNISQLSEKMNINPGEMRIYVDKLLKNGLITIASS